MMIGGSAVAQETQQAPAATTTPAAAKPEKFKDWDLYCPQPQAANEPRICEIRTIIIDKNGRRLGALAVAMVPKPETKEWSAIASALVPLGVDLTAEPAMKIDEGQPMQLKFLRCLQHGCEAMTPLSAEQQTAMRGGAKAKVGVGVGGGRNAVFEFSLSGFTAALDALKKRSGVK
ncbi:invasion associated locus B family protein [Dongia deserti]|uniref:invasion associated locus B family protein n=1 Tax=Dongia deserti TaxID=2268030 RepID=UPI0013C47402|nr:invasion associated locus B family protein [Dongia deserti]